MLCDRVTMAIREYADWEWDWNRGYICLIDSVCWHLCMDLGIQRNSGSIWIKGIHKRISAWSQHVSLIMLLPGRRRRFWPHWTSWSSGEWMHEQHTRTDARTHQTCTAYSVSCSWRWYLSVTYFAETVCVPAGWIFYVTFFSSQHATL